MQHREFCTVRITHHSGPYGRLPFVARTTNVEVTIFIILLLTGRGVFYAGGSLSLFSHNALSRPEARKG